MKFFFCIKVLFFFSLLFPILSYASLQPPLPLDDYFTQTWDTRDGLPHNGINALAQTTDGYIWVATWEGFARFNGREFKLFTRGSKAGLPDSAVKSLTTLDTGELIVAGARGGLSIRKNRQWQPLQPSLTLIHHAIFDRDKNIWLALEGKGLIFRDKTTGHDETIISNLRAFKLLLDHDNTLWVATNKGLYSLKNKTVVSHFDNNFGLPNTEVYSLLLTHENQLIVGTKQGAYILKNNRFTLLHEKFANKAVNSLLQDSNNDIWFGTQKHGVFRLSSLGLENLDDSDSLPNNRITSLLQDKENSIWIGTNSGLFRLKEAPFITLTAEKGLAGDYIRTVLSDQKGSLWIGSSKGLNKLENHKISTIQSPLTGSKKDAVSVLSLALGEADEVLVGSYNSGVFKVKNNTMQPYLNKSHHLPSNEIRSLLFDSKKNTWIGTSAGLVKVSKTGEMTLFNKESGLPANFIMALTEDGNGKIWIGTGVGIASYYNGVMQVYRLNETFEAEYAFGFFVEKKAIWLTTDRGLITIDLQTDSIKAITRKNGLPIDKFFQIIIDKNDVFWLSSNRGVIKISRAEINKGLADSNANVNFEVFGEGSGLLSSQANGGSTPAATLHNDGSVWFATAKGASQVTHERLNRMAEKTLPVIIEQLIVDNHEYPLTSTMNNELNHITLKPGASRISIYYAGLGFLMSDHIQYQTQLIGFDPVWLDKKSQTYTEFTNLPPGEYTFKMRAKYPNGQWKNQQASLTFIIPSYFWQTLWFKAFTAFLIIILFYLFYRYRVLLLQQREEKLKHLVAKQTLDLKKQTELFAYQAEHDQLTGLSNRRAFDKWCDNDFNSMKQENSCLSLAIIDIDHFKLVNDNYSHLVGDQVIQMFAQVLQQLLLECPYKVKLARWGGEEFTMLIYTDKIQAKVFCEMVRKRIEEHDFSSIAKKLMMTISIGLTDNQLLQEYRQMISQADHALYFAKYNGRNQVRIFQENDDNNNQKINERIDKITRSKKRE
ncbi:MAG: diguanylate cyclase [Colwellia sp.]|nr:diguanylate cyclase [Colwellia sp.]